jgi:hypothetical protein
VSGAHHVREAVVGLAGAQDPRALVEELDLGAGDDVVEYVGGSPLERREPPQEARDLVHRLLLLASTWTYRSVRGRRSA